jgi:jasmonoyl-L-amino acid hydrolase
VPAGFYYIGVRNETLGSVHTGHSPYFMVDEDVLDLPTGAAFHAAVAERFLAEHASLMEERSGDSSSLSEGQAALHDRPTDWWFPGARAR